MDITGAWDEYEVFIKFNDMGSQNGEFITWRNGSLLSHWTNIYNTANVALGAATGATRDGVSLADYSGSSGFHEDYKKWYISYDRPTGRGV